MNQKFAVFDIDGTLIRWQLYHAVANHLAKHGYLEAGDYDAVRGARMLWKQRTHDESFKEYEQRLVAAFEKLLIRLSVEQFDEATNTVFYEYKDQVYTYTRDKIAKLKTQGYMLLAISGSQAEILGKIAGYYGFDDFVGSYYHRKDNYFTGKSTTALNAKDKTLSSLIVKHNLTLEGSIGVGDSENDIAMLKMVKHPVAFNPTKALLAEARARKWQIVIERKNVVYELNPQDHNYVLK